MIELIEANWPLFLIALVIGIAVAWFIFKATRRTKVQTDSRDVLDENAAPAARNQALIDAPPVSAAPVVPPATTTSVDSEAVLAEKPAPKASSDKGDDLGRIKGVGPKLQTILRAEGVTSFAQIAAWSDEDIDRIDEKLGRFAGRIRRDDWVTQAALLGQGDTGAYEDKFGKL